MYEDKLKEKACLLLMWESKTL